jgi:hypothetical protein
MTFAEMKRANLYFTPKVYQWLASKAKAERRSISSMAEHLIDAHRQQELDALLAEIRSDNDS